MLTPCQWAATIAWPGYSRCDTIPDSLSSPGPVMRTLPELFNLTGRVAIVTGGSRGLGEEMAEGLAEAGASLMLCARREQWLTPTLESFRGRGFKVEGMVCDVSVPEQVQAVVDKTIATYGQVDILVNNAGISWGAEPEDMPIDKWQKVIDINLTGAFLFSQAAGREMLKRQYGRIINIASIAGLHGSVNGSHYAGYAASKAGLMGLTRELAASWGAPGHSRQRHRAGVLPFAPGGSRDRKGRTADQGHQPDSTRRRCGRAQRRRRISRVRRIELHHRTNHRRRRWTHDQRMMAALSQSKGRPHARGWITTTTGCPTTPITRAALSTRSCAARRLRDTS